MPMLSTFNLTIPPSVNKSRRINWAAHKEHKAWSINAGKELQAIGALKDSKTIKGQYAARIVINENLFRGDLDNLVKALLDFAVRHRLVEGDGPKHLREIRVRWSNKMSNDYPPDEAPRGVSLTLVPLGKDHPP